ncbi:MAG: hypothetical protein FKY71_05120 [Spiribacter salinus]|uniref:Right handed beta helix domain-containing protein n=1 Tax=Spiribacter salinus TaxID=1335746 RepID=A0A540VTQ4_9GAMM|nr:MAG: hypothetical protein FKY71_05120 [Spiribacter salinus]
MMGRWGPALRQPALAGATLGIVFAAVVPQVLPARTIEATPDNYQEQLSRLAAGDTLTLAAGEYREGLQLHDLTGLEGSPIVVEGPYAGGPAVFVAQRRRNTVSLSNVNHIVIRNLVLEGRGHGVDAVKLEGDARYGHQVTLEGLTIRGYDASRQNVGISTKAPAYGWRIRRNRISRVGTGLYLGDSDGTAPFVAGVIEGNFVSDTIGYNLQVKHQDGRPGDVGLPEGPSVTVVRDNVFSKASGGDTGRGARPNVLFGHWPPEEPGTYDRYLFYRNFLYENPTEALLQATGRLAVYNNVMVNTSEEGIAMRFVPHTDQVRYLEVFHNTVVTRDVGIAVWQDEPSDRRWVGANLVFGARPLEGRFDRSWNVTGSFRMAERWLRAPFRPPGELDLYPRASGPEMPDVPDGALVPYPGAERDFDGVPRETGMPGAYATFGEDQGRPLELTLPLVVPDG